MRTAVVSSLDFTAGAPQTGQAVITNGVSPKAIYDYFNPPAKRETYDWLKTAGVNLRSDIYEPDGPKQAHTNGMTWPRAPFRRFRAVR